MIHPDTRYSVLYIGDIVVTRDTYESCIVKEAIGMNYFILQLDEYGTEKIYSRKEFIRIGEL